MTIVIKTLTGKDIYLNLHPKSTTADLHYAIQAKEGLPPGQGRFIFAGNCTSQRSDHQSLVWTAKQLEDGQTLEYYGIKPQDFSLPPADALCDDLNRIAAEVHPTILYSCMIMLLSTIVSDGG